MARTRRSASEPQANAKESCSYIDLLPRKEDTNRDWYIAVDDVCRAIKHDSSKDGTVKEVGLRIVERNSDVFETDPKFKEMRSQYDAMKKEPLVRLEENYTCIDFASSTLDSLRNFPTHGNLQLLSLFLPQGDTSEQIYSIPINHRQVQFRMAEERITEAIFRPEYSSTSTDSTDAENQEDSSATTASAAVYHSKKLSKFDAGGNIIAVYPFEEVNGDSAEIGEADNMLPLETNYTVDTGKSILPLRLGNRVAQEQSIQAFESFLAMFRLGRHKNNETKPVKMSELAETFSYLRDFDFASNEGVRDFCDVVGLDLQREEPLTDDNIHHAKNQIGKVVKRLSAARFSMVEGSHRMTVVGMVCKGVMNPSNGSVMQKVATDASEVRKIPRGSPMNSVTKFDVYQFKEDTKDELSFCAKVKKLHEESFTKAAHQEGAMITHIKDELAFFIQNFLNHATESPDDITTTFWNTDKNYELLKNKQKLGKFLELSFKDNEPTFYTEMNKLLNLKSKAGDTVQQKVKALTDLLKKENKVHGHMLTSYAKENFNQKFLILVQLLLGGLLGTDSMTELRRFLSMTTTNKQERTRPDLPGQRLSTEMKMAYRTPAYMNGVFIDPGNTLWKEFLLPALKAQCYKHKIIQLEEGLEDDPEHRKSRNYVQRHSGRHEAALRSAYQHNLLKAWNEHGEDTKTNDEVLNFLMEYEVYRFGEPAVNVFLDREGGEDTKPCSMEIVQKLVAACAREVLSKTGGYAIMHVPWAKDDWNVGDPFGLTSHEGLILMSDGRYVGCDFNVLDILPQFLKPTEVAQYVFNHDDAGYQFVECLEAVAITIQKKCTDIKKNSDENSTEFKMIKRAQDILVKASGMVGTEDKPSDTYKLPPKEKAEYKACEARRKQLVARIEEFQQLVKNYKKHGTNNKREIRDLMRKPASKKPAAAVEEPSGAAKGPDGSSTKTAIEVDGTEVVEEVDRELTTTHKYFPKSKETSNIQKAQRRKNKLTNIRESTPSKTSKTDDTSDTDESKGDAKVKKKMDLLGKKIVESASTMGSNQAVAKEFVDFLKNPKESSDIPLVKKGKFLDFVLNPCDYVAVEITEEERKHIKKKTMATFDVNFSNILELVTQDNTIFSRLFEKEKKNQADTSKATNEPMENSANNVAGGTAPNETSDKKDENDSSDAFEKSEEDDDESYNEEEDNKTSKKKKRRKRAHALPVGKAKKPKQSKTP